MPITEDETTEILQALEHPAVEDKVGMLRIVAEDPTGSARVAEAVTRLLEDRSAAVLSIPYQVGEVRWAAAYALRAERRALGRTEPVVLADVPTPVSTAALGALARSAGLPVLPGTAGLLATFEALRERTLLPVSTLRLQP